MIKKYTKLNALILVDNGHGSNTLGKLSPDGKLKEYKWCREIAKELCKELTKLGIKNLLVTPEDTDISISTRVNRINKLCKTNNCLLISIHNNASANGVWGSARGWSVFCSKNASDTSKYFASIMTDLAIKEKLMGNRSIPKEKFWTWSWTTKDIGILKSSNCPAVLTENMFMDNKEDCNFLLSEEGKKKLIKLHIDAICKILD